MQTRWLMLVPLLAGCAARDRVAPPDSVAGRQPAAWPAAADTVDPGSVVAARIVLERDIAGRLVARGTGYSFTLPAGTTVHPDSLGLSGFRSVLLSGPLRPTPDREPDQGPSGPQPVFQLRLSEVNLPAGVTAIQWVWRLREQRNRALGDEARLPEPAIDSIAPGAIRLELFCGDCTAREIWVPVGSRLLLLNYELGIHLSGSWEEQQEAVDGVLRAFRWN